MSRDKKFAKKLKKMEHKYGEHDDKRAFRKYREMKKEHRRFNDKRH
jgi:hypothetical protein